MDEFKFSTIEEAVEDLKAGKMIIAVDDPDRENEGDLICAAEHATLENVNFMASYAKGLICMPMSKAMTNKLGLEQMVATNTDNHCTAFTVSIDHVATTTGISALERSITAMKAVEDDAKPSDFRFDAFLDDYEPAAPKEYEFLQALTEAMEEADAAQMAEALLHHYKAYGRGDMARYMAFYLLPSGELKGIETFRHREWDDLIGYAVQKEKLLRNTVNFIEGRQANHGEIDGRQGLGVQISQGGPAPRPGRTGTDEEAAASHGASQRHQEQEVHPLFRRPVL